MPRRILNCLGMVAQDLVYLRGCVNERDVAEFGKSHFGPEEVTHTPQPLLQIQHKSLEIYWYGDIPITDIDTNLIPNTNVQEF